MTIEILLVLIIMGAALVLFLTGWLRMDIVALMIIGTLAFTGLLSPEESLAGFSNPAVVTIWAMFILSAALYQTGVARIIGRQLQRVAGHSEVRLIMLIMIASGTLSAFMNNIGVAALMLPVVMDLSRADKIPPSRLLMPLAFSSQLGGLVTLIGTPPNLLISYALQDQGFAPFKLFDFTPIGFSALIGGILFMVLAGRHLLPKTDTLGDAKAKSAKKLSASYALQKQSFLLKVHSESELVGKTLAESRLRAGLGLNVLSIIRNQETVLDPGPGTIIRAGDKLHVQGSKENLTAMKRWRVLLNNPGGPGVNELLSQDLQIYEVRLPAKSPLVNTRLRETDFRKRLGLNVLAVQRGDDIEFTILHDYQLKKHDTLLIQGPMERLTVLEKEGKIDQVRYASRERLIAHYRLHSVLFLMEVTDEVELFERAISESQIGSAFGLTVLAKLGKDNKVVPYSPGSTLNVNDKLLIKGNIEDLQLLSGLKDLEILSESVPSTQSLETEDISMAEVVVAPRSMMAGLTLRDINFRRKFGLTVLAIWREGKPIRTDLHNLPLRFGDALLLYGKNEKLELIGAEPDLIMLTDTKTQPLRTEKAMTAVMVMAAVLLPVVFGIVPLAIAALVGIALMVLTGCLRMEEAYRAIEWRSVFLIAGMLPLGVAMEQTGAAMLLAEGVVEALGRFGPWGIISGLYLITAVSALAIPPPALVVIMSPVALQAAATFDISPHSLMMAIAMAAAACFMSPVSHPANLLVMGPGGYRFRDYLKVGLPLTLVVMAIVLLLLPVFWPL